MVNWLGAKVITLPGLMIPVSTMAASPDLIDLGLVENDNLGGKVLSTDSGPGLFLESGATYPLDILDRDVLDVESGVVFGEKNGLNGR